MYMCVCAQSYVHMDVLLYANDFKDLGGLCYIHCLLLMAIFHPLQKLFFLFCGVHRYGCLCRMDKEKHIHTSQVVHTYKHTVPQKV